MINSPRRFRLILSFSLFFCILILMTSLCLGNRIYSPLTVLLNLFQKADPVAYPILHYARLPRVLACFLAGGALSLSGAVLQKVLANQLASPSIIGVNAGAGLGITISCACGIFSGWIFSLSAFVGSLITVLVLVILSRKFNVSKTTVILGGVALNSMLTAFSEAITVLDPSVAAMTTEFRVGGFSAVSAEKLLPSGILILMTFLVLMLLTNELELLSLGDESAQGLGLKVRTFRLLFLILAALLAGCAVSFAGLLSFIGLLVPHAVRKFSGSEVRHHLPLCFLLGAGFTALCDLAARLFFMPYELPVGVIMAVLGAPCFVLLLLRKKGGFEDA